MNYKKTAKLLPARKAGEDFDSKAFETHLEIERLDKENNLLQEKLDSIERGGSVPPLVLSWAFARSFSLDEIQLDLFRLLVQMLGICQLTFRDGKCLLLHLFLKRLNWIR